MSGRATAALRDTMIDRARSSISKLREAAPHFPFKIALAGSYEEVFSGRSSSPVDADTILEMSTSHRRILLTGRGGGGKTEILGRIARKALERTVVPVIIDLANWTGEDNKAWELHRASDEDVFYFLLRKFAALHISPVELNVLSGIQQSLLLVDGLSEVEARIGESILNAVDSCLIALPGTSVVAADRLVRRDLASDRWRLVALLPLSDDDVRSVLRTAAGGLERYERAEPQLRALLRSPYYLHRFLENPDNFAANKAAQQHREFLVHSSMSEAELTIASAAAFEFYHQSHSRTFPLAAFEAATSPDIVRKLRGAGALTVDSEQRLAYFDHQLKHDFLAARHLAFHPTKWESDAFDVVTLNAASFDVLGLVLEQIDGAGDEFVRKVYDWNPYGAAHVVAEDRERRINKVSAPMRLVIQAVMAERRFHLIRATVQQAEDALRLIQSAESERLLQAASFSEVVKIVNRLSSDETEWFRDWQRVFTRPAGEQPTDADLATIRREDSIVGWTYANIVKRLALTAGQQETLRGWIVDSSPEVRWRIVHALGAFPNLENRDFLFDVLNEGGDTYRWVRYGATRSLVEIAARDPEGGLRQSVMDQFAARTELLLKDRQSLGEFARSILIEPTAAPKDWAEQVKTVLVALYKASLSSETKERWLRLTDEIDAKYTGA